MSKKTPQKNQSIDKIEAAAIKLFARGGYSNTSLESIAEEAGFTKGAIYYHFKTKEALLLHVINSITERSIVKAAAQLRNLDATAIEKLETLTSLQARWAAERPEDLVILILTSIEFQKDIDAVVKSAIQNFYSIFENLLRDILEQGIKKGEIKDTIDVESVILATIARHDGNILLWHRSGRDPKIGRLLAAASRKQAKTLGKA